MNPPRTQRRRTSPSNAILRLRWGLGVLTLGLGGWIYASQRPPVRPSHTEALEVSISNLDCHVWCPIKIDRALDSLPGIFDLHVDVDRHRLTARIDPLAIERDAIVRRLRTKGWNVTDGAAPPTFN